MTANSPSPRPARRRHRRLAVAGLAAALAVMAAAPASGLTIRIGLPFLSLPSPHPNPPPPPTPSGLVVDVGSGFQEGPTAPLLNAADLAPGATVSGVVRAKNLSPDKGALSVKAENVATFEHDCLEPESVDANDDCDPAGDLQDHLVVKVFRDEGDDGVFEPDPVFTGSIDDLAAGVQLSRPGHPLAHNDVDRFRFEATVPSATGNEVMSDEVRFDLVFALDGTPGHGHGGGHHPAPVKVAIRLNIGLLLKLGSFGW